MNTFYIGCDVSKGYADFTVLDKKKNVVEKVFQLDDTYEGHSALADYLSKFLVKDSQACFFAAVESTGGYEDNWYALFLRLGSIHPLKVSRLNPYVVQKHHEALMNRNKTDAISAEDIASYLISYPEKVTYDQDEYYNRLCREWNSIQLFIKQKSQLLNQLNSLLYQSNPGLLQYCKESVPSWVLTILRRYPIAKKLANAKAKTLCKISSVTPKKAKCIIEDSKTSVASHMCETDEFMIREIVRQIERLGKSIKKQKEYLKTNCQLAEIDLLTTFKGIGWYSAIGLLINIVSVVRFPTVKHLVSYFGLHPVYKESGDGSWGNHMSKKGKKQLRVLLFNVIRSAISCNPIIKKRYEECVKRGMPKMAAIRVCMHKILRIVYGMLKHKTLFNPQIDEANQKIKN